MAAQATTLEAFKVYLEGHDCEADLVAWLVGPCKMKCINDLLVYFNADNWRTDIDEVLQKRWPVGEGEGKFAFEDVRSKVARTRAAYKEALEAQSRKEILDKKAAEKSDEAPDLNKALTQPEEDALKAAWRKQQKWFFVLSMQPNLVFRDRCLREFQLRRVFLHSVARWSISAEKDKLATPKQDTDLNGNPVPEHTNRSHPSFVVRTEVARTRPIYNTLYYLTGLGVIMNTYAYVGAFLVEKPGVPEPIPFFNYEECVGCVDQLTEYLADIRGQLGSEQRALYWLQRRDELVRGQMAQAINDGKEAKTTGTEALAVGLNKVRFLVGSD